MSKIPSDRSIRGALTVLKRAGILKLDIANIETTKLMITGKVVTEIEFDAKFVTPKKSIKKRLPKQKIVKYPHYISPSTDGY